MHKNSIRSEQFNWIQKFSTCLTANSVNKTSQFDSFSLRPPFTVIELCKALGPCLCPSPVGCSQSLRLKLRDGHRLRIVVHTV